VKPIHINLDDYKTIERKTAGWTDDQIRNYPREGIEDQIRSAELSIAKLEDAIEGQRSRIRDLSLILQRKRELGG